MLAQAIKRRLSKEENQKGFTLIELLAVIVILGIIAVIAIPLIGNVIKNSKESADAATARQVYDAARLYIVGEKNGDFVGAKTVDLSDIQKFGYIDSPLSLPSSKDPIASGTVNFNAKGQLADTAAGNDAVILNVNVGGASTTTAVKFSAANVLSSKKE
ncbi:type II secretion system protein [Paenibacillus sp. FSL R5-0914]|uniref:type II secretion system protein n=1 Tax=Paenibacillus sp. FSL R5-0914 TaxID=2921665 RepID=UPI0030F96438